MRLKTSLIHTMKSKQSGFIGAVAAVAILLILGGVIWFAAQTRTSPSETATARQSLLNGYEKTGNVARALNPFDDRDTDLDIDARDTDNDGTNDTLAARVAQEPEPVAKTVTTREIAYAPVTYRTTYSTSPYGMTLPFGEGAVLTNTSSDLYAGVPATATYTYNVGGVPKYKVNVFTKEQWNNIRIKETQEMIESDLKDLNHYYGEGRYFGESMDYIFTYTTI